MYKVLFVINMWKCVPRRAREIERRANHLDKRGPGPFVNCGWNDEKHKRQGPPCEWFKTKGCWGSNGFKNNTNNNNKWNFQHLTSSWLSAITWSGALVFGWYTSQMIHLKYKIYSRCNDKCPPTLLSSLHPYLKPAKKNYTNETVAKAENLVGSFTNTIQLIANERSIENKGKTSIDSTSTTDNHSSDLMGEVLNSIENKLGLAAIENGQLQDGLKLLRSAANRNYAPALYNLGICYETGLGVQIDEKTAMELFRSAATLEHPGALYNLGIYYGQGRGGLRRDTITATRLLRLAAVQGQQDAIEALKDLDEDIKEPIQNKRDIWFPTVNANLQDPTTDNGLATHTLYVDNVGKYVSHLTNVVY